MKLMITCGEATDFYLKKEEGKTFFSTENSTKPYTFIYAVMQIFSKKTRSLPGAWVKYTRNISMRGLAKGRKMN